jgi:hypothetical protein
VKVNVVLPVLDSQVPKSQQKQSEVTKRTTSRIGSRANSLSKQSQCNEVLRCGAGIVRPRDGRCSESWRSTEIRTVATRAPDIVLWNVSGKVSARCSLLGTWECIVSLIESSAFSKCLVGTFGEVRRAVDQLSGKHVAVKYVRILSKKSGMPKAIFRELESLKQLSESPYVIKLFDVYTNESNLCLVMEYVESDLAEVIEQTGQGGELLSRPNLKALFRMILQGIAYCHSRNVMHRDIKPASKCLHNCPLQPRLPPHTASSSPLYIPPSPSHPQTCCSPRRAW